MRNHAFQLELQLQYSHDFYSYRELARYEIDNTVDSVTVIHGGFCLISLLMMKNLILIEISSLLVYYENTIIWSLGNHFGMTNHFRNRRETMGSGMVIYTYTNIYIEYSVASCCG